MNFCKLGKNHLSLSIFFVLVFIIIFTAISCRQALATDGILAYRSNTGANTVSSPKIRLWSSSGVGSWGNEVVLPTAGSPIRYLRIRQSPMDSKVVLVTQSDDGNLEGYVCMSSCDNANNWVVTNNIGNVWSAAPATSYRGFDIAFEKTTGNLMIAYAVRSTNTARDIAFKYLTESTTSFNGLTEQYIDDASANGGADLNYSWIEMDEDPAAASNEIILAGFDFTGSDINAWVWNGATWANRQELTAGSTSSNGYENLAVRYAADGTKGMVVGGTANAGAIAWQYWNGTAWTGAATFDPNGGSNDAAWLTLKADPATDDLQLVDQEFQGTLYTVYWSGAAWTASAQQDAGVDTTASRCSDFEWNPSGSTGKLVWDTDLAAGTTISEKQCAPQCNGATTTPGNYANAGGWLTLYRDPTAADTVNILGFRLNALFDLGAFRYDGAAYTNYGDATATSDTIVSTFESYDYDYERDTVAPVLTIQPPTPNSATTQTNTSVFVNISSNEFLASANLEWNGVNISMSNISNTSWYYNQIGLQDGLYNYTIYGTDLAGNIGFIAKRNITINTPPTVNLIIPTNNTLNFTATNITFFYNVTDVKDNISRCVLIIDAVGVLNTTSIPVSKNISLNFSYNLTSGQHNWSVWCNDTAGYNSTSEIRNITITLSSPNISLMIIDDGLLPAGEIILSAGNTKSVLCQIVVTDAAGVNNILNASAKLYYYLNKSSDSDNNNTHYANSSCTLNQTTASNKTFDCKFDVYYFSNNGTWYCNATVYNNFSKSVILSSSTIIDPLYAVNLTDGLDFGASATAESSINISLNFTNLGNMPINVSLQGYAKIQGDNIGMNCSDNTNISISNIRFSSPALLDFSSKTALDGSIQNLTYTIPKPTSTNLVTNYSYWQIFPDPGANNRKCQGYIIFTAGAS